jgi:hypothetical protein
VTGRLRYTGLNDKQEVVTAPVISTFSSLSRYWRPGLKNIIVLFINWGTLLVAQWLRYCATNQKVAGSIPDGVIEIFH